MRSSLTRHLQPILRDAKPGGDVSLLGITPDGDVSLPEDFEWHDYAVFLLHVAAEIEHSLMVQYLYAAYSLDDHADARVWREVILGIAKEEMGHLITVQNILRAIGAPIHLEREDYPYRSEFYPFPFRLEPLTRKSLARYIYAEAPPENEWVGQEAEEIRELATEGQGADINRVGRLYTALVRLFQDPQRIRDEQFLAATVPYQAKPEEYGRGYSRGRRGDQSGANAAETPDVLIDVVSNRAETVRALERIAEQGEAPVRPDEPKSHFARFLEIYRALNGAEPPTRNIPVNPTTNAIDANTRTVVKNGTAVRWCQLFDLRYRMLLFRLKHAFFVRAGETVNDPTERGNLIAWTFAEMYNLRAIAGIVMTLPLDKEEEAPRAGPPFEMPYTISMPDWDSDKWRAHRDLIANSTKLSNILTAGVSAQADYLAALRDNDALADRIIQTLLAQALQEEGRTP